MNIEIEAKFLQIDIDDLRDTLSAAGAQLIQSMADMKRAIIDYDDVQLQKNQDAYIRVRDEGRRITLTFKKFESLEFGGAKEYETEVGDFETTVKIFEAAGLVVKSYQESRRETWELDGAEVVIDEWPWLDPYIEIEGSSKKIVQDVAEKLGYDWKKAVFGDVMAAYRLQYPHLTVDQTIGQIKSVKFGDPIPDIFMVK